jgi:hypothetical protein
LVVFRDGILLTLLRETPFYFGPFILVVAIARFSSASLTGQPVTQGSVAVSSSPADRRKELARRA